MGEDNWRREFRSMVNIYGFSCFHFTLVSESRFLDPGHNCYCWLIFIVLFSAPSPVPDFLFWPICPYRIPIVFFSSTTVFPLNLLQKLRKQFRSMTPGWQHWWHKQKIDGQIDSFWCEIQPWNGEGCCMIDRKRTSVHENFQHVKVMWLNQFPNSMISTEPPPN